MICTFYSYKGGAGRSMAMANVADVLSRRGLKVLMVDFDLEAPGLEQFFQINHDGVRRHAGLLDLLLGYKQAMSVASTQEAAFRRIEKFICPVYERLPGGGRLDILSAGQRQDPEQLARYALNLRTFDWQDFYFNWQGGLFFEWLRRSLVPQPYDLVLVDSRTGVTEMGGICGYQLADTIVMLCAANHQNLQGTRNMLRDFRSPAVEALRRGRKLDIVIVPARIEHRDPQLLEEFFARFDEAFDGFVPDALQRARLDFRALTIPYEPRFAFEERVISDPAQASTREKIAQSFVRLAEAVALLAAPESELARAVQLSEAGAVAQRPSTRSAAAVPPAPAQYDAAKRFADYDVFIDSSGRDREIVDAINRELKTRALSVFLDREDIEPGADRQAIIEEAVFHSRVLLFCIGPQGLSEWRRRTLATALKARERGQSLSIIPVLLPGSSVDPLRDTPLINIMALDLRRGLDAEALDRVSQALEPSRSSPAGIEAESREPFRGPRPFAEFDADLFFGREKLVERLVPLVAEGRLVTVVGPSGCGKTSLINAGVVPQLRRQARPGADWTVTRVTPGAHPRRSVVEALLDRQDPDRVDAREPTEWPPEALAEAFRRAADLAAPGRLLLFIDDLEDVLTMDNDREREQFSEALATALDARPQNLSLVLVLGSDFLGQLRGLPDLWKRLEASIVEVPLLTAEELRRAVEDPVERVGAAFEPGLVDRIVSDMQGEGGALPLLQRLMLTLWEQRRGGWLTNAAFDSVKGLRGILATQAEEVYGTLGAAEQTAVRWMMLRLVRIGRSGEHTRRRLPQEELLPANADSMTVVAHTVAAQAFIDAGLLVSGEEDERRVVEPAHESLIRGWARLHNWLDEEKVFLTWRESLRLRVADWQKAQRNRDLLLRGTALAEAEAKLSERGGELNAEERAFVQESMTARAEGIKRREQRRRLAFSVLATAAVVFFALSIVAFWQTRKARRALQQADVRLQIAEDTIVELRAATESLQTLAESRPAAAPAAEEKRQEAERALTQLRGSLKQLQGRVEQSKEVGGALYPASEWLSDYQKGLDALKARRLNDAVTLLEQAAAARSQEGKVRRGMIIVEYYPYYYLGLAYRELGQLDEGRKRFLTSVHPNSRRKLEELERMLQDRKTPPTVTTIPQ